MPARGGWKRSWVLYALAGAVAAAVLVALNLPVRLPRAASPLRATPGPTASAPPAAAAPETLAASAAAFHGLGQLAFVSRGSLYVLDESGLSRVALSATRPAWSADGRWLAFLGTGPTANSRALWIAAADGQDAHEVPPGAASSPWSTGFAWSPAADVLAATRPGAGGGLWLVPASGQPREVAAAGMQVGTLAWSPHGRHIAYSATLPFRNPADRSDALYTVPAAGGPPTQRFVAKGAGILVARWLPNGQGLLFWVDPQHSGSIAADGLKLYSLSVAGGTAKPLTTTLPYPDWIASPSGGRILLVAGGARITWDQKSVSTCDLANGQCRPLPQPAGMVTLDPAWSPSGGQVAYVRAVSRGNTWGWSTCSSPQACRDRAAQQAAADQALAAWVRTRTLWLAAPDGSAAREVGHAGPGVYHPMWSRGGHHLLYVRDNALWLIDLRGGAPVRVAGPLLNRWDPFGFYGHVDWSQVVAWHR